MTHTLTTKPSVLFVCVKNGGTPISVADAGPHQFL
jgi:hypothetical protein